MQKFDKKFLSGKFDFLVRDLNQIHSEFKYKLQIE